MFYELIAYIIDINWESTKPKISVVSPKVIDGEGFKDENECLWGGIPTRLGRSFNIYLLFVWEADTREV